MTGEEIIKQRDALKTQRSCMEGNWSELSKYFTPCQINPDGVPEVYSATEVMDTTGKNAALIAANGLASLIIPRQEEWFEFRPPYELQGDDSVVRFLRECSEVTRQEIERSNFYEEAGECLLDSVVYGTSALYCGDLDEADGELHFRQQRIATYYITEDSKGRVNAFYRDLKLTAEQCVEEFGEDNLPQEIKEALKIPSKSQDKFEFVHAVYRRKNRSKLKDASEQDKMPWGSCTAYIRTKDLVKEEGLQEFPFAVHRYRKFGGFVWGFGPGAVCKGDCRQLEFLNEMADALTERLSFPTAKAPASMEGQVRMGPGEINYGESADELNQLQEFVTAGRYDVSKDRMQDKRQAINDAFNVDLFKFFAMRAQEHGPLTATEASLVQNEKYSQFLPIYGRLVSEFAEVLLTRVFGILLRAGRFPDAPPAVRDQISDGKGGFIPGNGVALPGISFKNRIVLAQQVKQSQAIVEYLNTTLPLFQVVPDAANIFFGSLNLKIISRDLARNSQVPESWIKSLEQIDQEEAAEAAARQAQFQAQQAESASKTAANLGKAPPGIAQAAASAIA